MEILNFIIILSVLILVHELGHFLTARRFGIKVEEFGFGLPPRVWGKKIGETIYSLNLLPFGGFVRMLGEDSNAQVGDKKDIGRAFFKQSKSARIMVIVAGVVMNFLLGIILFAAIYTKIGIPEEVSYIKVSGIAAGSPAELAGIKADDRIVAVSGLSWPEDNSMVMADFIAHIDTNRGNQVTIQLADRQVTVVPRLREETPEGEGSLGVKIANVDLVQYPLWQRPFRGMVHGVKEAWGWGEDILLSLGKTFYNLFKGDVPQEVAGPVGIYQISKDVVNEGWIAILQFVAILSVNLAILNLLPIPALDGGRLMFILIEVVTRRRVKPEWEQWAHFAGMVLLLGLMVAITWADIVKLRG